jgi:hypothetical protein
MAPIQHMQLPYLAICAFDTRGLLNVIYQKLSITVTASTIISLKTIYHWCHETVIGVTNKKSSSAATIHFSLQVAGNLLRD